MKDRTVVWWKNKDDLVKKVLLTLQKKISQDKEKREKKMD